MNLNTGKVMNEQNMATTPITETVISKVEEMAEKQFFVEVKHCNKETDLVSPNADWELVKNMIVTMKTANVAVKMMLNTIVTSLMRKWKNCC